MLSNKELEQLLPELEQDRIEKTISVCPTYAGILMFGTNPRFFIPGAFVQYVRFQGEDEVSDFEFEHRFDGDLTTQLGQMEEFIKANIVKMVLPELGGNYVTNYPLSAVKELLFNAVIHKDYQSNGPALSKNGNPEPEFITNQTTSFLVKIFKRR